MKTIKTFLFLLLSGLLLASSPAHSQSKKRGVRDFKHSDTDGDGKLSREEWLRRGNFAKLDADNDGYLSLEEMLVHYRGALVKRDAGEGGEKRREGRKGRKGRRGKRGKRAEKSFERPPERQQGATPELDPRAMDARVESYTLDAEILCAIARKRGCDMSPAIGRGLVATGLGPEFPEGADCHGIDDYYAMDYSFKRNRESYHGGIDLPTAWGTPMIAVAAGTVVGKFRGEDSARGKEIVLRHSPEDTGIPLWIYTQYAHLDVMPKLAVGQRVKMGEILGPTGNSGISPRTRQQSKRRRPAIHFAAWYSRSEKYTVYQDVIVPVDGYWMDPNALYLKTLPLDSSSMKALGEAKKGVPISIMFKDGEAFPADTKLVWPYKCGRD